jgi:hypothetical protein
MKNTLFNEFVEDGVGISSGGGTVAVERPGLEGPSGGAPNADQGPESDSFEEIDLAVADPFSGPTGELTPDAIAAAVERGMSRGAPQQQQVQERRAPTREEQEAFMAQMGRPQVTPEFINNLMNADIPADQKLAAMQQLLDGTAQYAMRVAQTAFESQLSRIQGEYQPLVQQTQQQAHKEYLGQIEQNYPSLSGHGRIVNLAIQELKRTGYRPRTPELDQQAIAITAGRMIKEIKPDFVLQKAKGGGRGSVPAMGSGLNRAGGGGSQTKKPETPKDPGLAVLQARRQRLGIGQ